MIGGRQTSGPCPGERDQKNLKEVWEYSLKDGHGAMNLCFDFCIENPPCSRGSHSRSSNHCVCDRSVYTLTCCTHIFLLYIHCACTSRILMHIHAWLKIAVRMSSSLFHLTFSLLMFHPSLLLLFLDGHFETIPTTTSLTLTSTTSCRTFPTKKRRSSALRTRTSSLANWPSSFLPQVMSPKSSTRSLPWIMTRRSSTNQTTVSPTSRKPTNENSGQFGVSTVFESSVLHVAHWWFCSLERKQRKQQSRNRCKRERERERGKRRFCDQCCRVDVNEKSTEQ